MVESLALVELFEFFGHEAPVCECKCDLVWLVSDLNVMCCDPSAILCQIKGKTRRVYLGWSEANIADGSPEFFSSKRLARKPAR